MTCAYRDTFKIGNSCKCFIPFDKFFFFLTKQPKERQETTATTTTERRQKTKTKYQQETTLELKERCAHIFKTYGKPTKPDLRRYGNARMERTPAER